LELSLLQKIAVYILPLILAITVHEASHAYMAHKFGDDLAYRLGRLSLNPLKHIDPLGTIAMPLVGIAFGGFIFGWAKPVPINYAILAQHKRGLLWVALAGPLSNFAMALIAALILKLVAVLPYYAFISYPVSLMAQAGIMINISLFIFNLLPLLPLDGGQIILSLLPKNLAIKYANTERYGLIIILVLFISGVLSYVLQPIFTSIVGFIFSLIQ
jgi:Zn-dependent protease